MINNTELKEVEGGSSKWIIAGVAGGIISFVIGIVDGYLRPLKCNKWKTTN